MTTLQPLKVVQYTRDVRLDGRKPLLLNPYPGNNKIKLPVEKRFYFGNGGKSLGLVLPIRNIVSFLGAINSPSASRYVGDGRKWKDIANAFTGMVSYEPDDELPLLRGKGTQIRFEGFDRNGITKYCFPGRLPKGAVSDTEPRPLIDAPWYVQFRIRFIQNEFFDESMLLKAFQLGGQYLGFGTYRSNFGKFEVTKWEVVNEQEKKTGVVVVAPKKVTKKSVIVQHAGR